MSVIVIAFWRGLIRLPWHKTHPQNLQNEYVVNQFIASPFVKSNALLHKSAHNTTITATLIAWEKNNVNIHVAFFKLIFSDTFVQSMNVTSTKVPK